MIIVFFAWWSIWSSVFITMLGQAGIENNHAIMDGLICITLLAALSILVLNNMRYYIPKKEKYLYVLFVSFVLSALWLAAVRLFLKSIYKQDIVYLRLLQETSVMRFAIGFLILVCITLLGLLWYTQKEQQEENERRADLERLSREAELNKLRQQLQPHFLFNSLNSISALTGQQPEKARHMIQQLSDFLRGTIKNEAKRWVSLKEELEYLQLYLDIEKVRFGYRLKTDINCDENILQMKLPSLLLQPLLENAIKFGLYDTIGEVEISVSAKMTNDMLEVTVQNPFDEETSMPLAGTGFGLSSVKKRLYLLFGRHDLLEIRKEANKFITTVNIPQLATTI
jgi:two-component system LytT family sensor kinase